MIALSARKLVVQCVKGLRLEQIGHADAATGDLVFVTWPDSAGSSADGGAVRSALGNTFCSRWNGKYQMSAIADRKLVLDVDTRLDESVHLLDEGHRIDHDAVADDRPYPGRRMPLGISFSTYFLSPIYTV